MAPAPPPPASASISATHAAPTAVSLPWRAGRSHAESSAGQAWLLAAVIAVGALLRFGGLGRHSLWSDEIFVVWLSRAAWPALPHLVAGIDFHPPFYYLLMKAWIDVAGTGEVALRLPSATFSLAGVWLTFLLARQVAPGPVPLLAAALVAVAPFHVTEGQEARMYALLGALVVGSTVALRSAVTRGGVLRWGGYAAIATLMAYTSYLSAPVLTAQGLWVYAWQRRHLRAWVTCLAVLAVSYAPWIPSLWMQMTQSRGLTLIVQLHGAPAQGVLARMRPFADLMGLFAYGGPVFGAAGYSSSGAVGPLGLLLVLSLTAPSLVLVAFGAAVLSRDRGNLAVVGLPPVLTLGVAAGISLVVPVVVTRWFSFLVPFYATMLSVGLVAAAHWLGGRRASIVAVGMVWLLLCSVPVLNAYYREPVTWPFRWREAAQAVRERARPGDVLLFLDFPAEQTFRYYFREPHPSLNLSSARDDRARDASLQGLVGRYSRAWLVLNGPVHGDGPAASIAALAKTFRAVGFRDFGGAGVYLLEAGPASRR